MRQHFVSGAMTVNGVNDARIWLLINDLARTIQLLDCDIRTEEKRTLVSNQQDAAYSMLARTLRTRRDNLKATIAILEFKADAIQSAI